MLGAVRSVGALFEPLLNYDGALLRDNVDGVSVKDPLGTGFHYD